MIKVDINKIRIFRINTFIFITYLLIASMYIIVPKIIPANTYTLISPLLNLYILYNIEIPVKIQNSISWKYVNKSRVLKVFLKTLKKSKITPIPIPV